MSEAKKEQELFWRVGRRYKIVFTDGKAAVGKLLSLDRYELTFVTKVKEEGEEERPVEAVFFKHAIQRAYKIPPKKAEGES